MNTPRRTATRNEPKNDTVPYRKLPPHVTAWPSAFPTNGRQGFTTPAKWVEDHGEEFSIRSTNRLRERIDDGSVPSLDLSRLGAVLGGLVDVGGRGGDCDMVARDPATARPRLPRLRAVAYIQRDDGSVSSVPTATTIDLYASDDERDQKARAISKEAGPSKRPVRIAWICEHGGKTKVRHIEYRDREGDRVVPSVRGDDIEVAVAISERFTIYSREDLVNDVADRAGTLFLSGIGAARPAIAQISAPVVASTKAATSPATTQAPVADSMMDEARAMEVSQQFDPQAQSSPTTAHVLYVTSSSMSKVLDKAQNGMLVLHAGIVSNYGSFFPAGYKTGMMSPGSKVLFGIRDGDVVNIVASAPFAGLRRAAAGQILARANAVTKLSKTVEISLSELGVPVPNLPIVIANNCTVGGFNYPGSARTAIWNKVHEVLGWPR